MTNPDTLHPRTVEEITALRDARIAAWSNEHSESQLPQFPLIRDLRPLDELSREEWDRELIQCAVFAAVCMGGMMLAQFVWS